MNFLKMMKNAGNMKKEMGNIQRDLAGQTVERSSRGVTVVARCDMSIENIKIDDDMMKSTPDRLGETIAKAANSALDAAKKEAGKQMSALTDGMGLGDMLK